MVGVLVMLAHFVLHVVAFVCLGSCLKSFPLVLLMNFVIHVLMMVLVLQDAIYPSI
jgi:hypothetical protein